MREQGFRFWLALGSWLAEFSLSRAFSFSYTAPKSCDPLNVTWTGGTAPYYLLIAPPGGTPRNLSIPSDANGIFTTTLDLAAGRSFILTMSDATGFGSAGSSDLLTVGGGETQCNTTDPSPAFTFQLSSNLQQCGEYALSGYGSATGPIHLRGLIPIGSAFSVDVPDGSSYNWTVNMSSGTRFVLFMEDANGNLSTSSPTETVADSGNSSCINANSPHSTLSSVTQEPTANPTSSTGPSSSSGSEGHGNNAAVIGGSVGGAIVFILLVALLIWWLMRRKRDPMQQYARKRQKKGMEGMRTLDLASSVPNLAIASPSPNRLPPLEFEPQPFILPGGSGNGDAIPLSATSHTHVSSNEPPQGDSAATMGHGHGARSPSQATNSSKAALAGTSGQGLAPQPRFVLHTDAGSIDNVNASTLELPPTYNAAAAGQDSSTAPSPPPPASSAGHVAPDQNRSLGDSPSEGSTPPSQNQPTREAASSTTHLTIPRDT